MLAAIAEAVWLWWRLDLRGDPHTVKKDQASLAYELQRAGWVSPHINGKPRLRPGHAAECPGLRSSSRPARWRTLQGRRRRHPGHHRRAGGPQRQGDVHARGPRGGRRILDRPRFQVSIKRWRTAVADDHGRRSSPPTAIRRGPPWSRAARNVRRDHRRSAQAQRGGVRLSDGDLVEQGRCDMRASLVDNRCRRRARPSARSRRARPRWRRGRRSPVRIRRAEIRSRTKTLPSPILPVLAADGDRVGDQPLRFRRRPRSPACTLGSSFTSYSAPR